ncbi:hypothetical protein [Actinacidiphila acidipaludis]|uniref:Uncharacterized protein n=1 Tax=Actinacidiphila acidipaludis TaxID=2873382 RepID=A0ABS7QCT0_9ACTN|nr:hypothetical protein [Streptomyces acidipaludis]MBY8880963.1 hypothetical protein [Streptomyces acidipaludis]
MSSTITAGVNRLRRALGTAVSWSPHAPAVATGPADLDLPLALAAGLAPAPRAPEVSAARARHRTARRRAATVRR